MSKLVIPGIVASAGGGGGGGTGNYVQVITTSEFVMDPTGSMAIPVVDDIKDTGSYSIILDLSSLMPGVGMVYSLSVDNQDFPVQILEVDGTGITFRRIFESNTWSEWENVGDLVAEGFLQEIDGYDSSKTQVLKNSTGTLQWSEDSGGGTVDQTYDSTSTNAQSGTAVAEAIAPALKNKSTQTSGSTSSLTLCTNDSVSTTSQRTVCIQPDKSNNNLGNDSVVVGSNAGGGNTSYIVAIGSAAQCSSENEVCIGYKARTYNSNATSVGMQTRSRYGCVSLGAYAECDTSNAVYSIVIGGGDSSNHTTCSQLRSIAIGPSGTYNNVTFKTSSTAQDAIQLGTGTNNTAKTLQVYEWPLLDGNTGKIPAERLPSIGGAPTITWYKGNTGTTVTIADTTNATLVKVYKNGLLLEPSIDDSDGSDSEINDYSISGTTLTLTTALVATDKISVEVF